MAERVAVPPKSDSAKREANASASEPRERSAGVGANAGERLGLEGWRCHSCEKPAGFEHCVANMYFIPLGILLSAGAPGSPSWGGLAANLVPVTLGNIAGGSLMVAAVYYLIYNRALKGAS